MRQREDKPDAFLCCRLSCDKSYYCLLHQICVLNLLKTSVKANHGDEISRTVIACPNRSDDLRTAGSICDLMAKTCCHKRHGDVYILGWLIRELLMSSRSQFIWKYNRFAIDVKQLLNAISLTSKSSHLNAAQIFMRIALNCIQVFFLFN